MFLCVSGACCVLRQGWSRECIACLACWRTTCWAQPCGTKSPWLGLLLQDGFKTSLSLWFVWAVLVDGLVLDGAFGYIPVPSVLRAFDSWFHYCWCGLPDSPPSATSVQVSCCKYQLWFARQGGQDLLPMLDHGRWQAYPEYIRWSAGMSQSKLC